MQYIELTENECELDIEFYANIVWAILFIIMIYALIAAIDVGMEKDIAAQEYKWSQRCATGKINPNYCKNLRI